MAHFAIMGKNEIVSREIKVDGKNKYMNIVLKDPGGVIHTVSIELR